MSASPNISVNSSAVRSPFTDEHEDDESSMLPVDEPLVTAIYDVLSNEEGETVVEMLAGIKRSLDRLTKVAQQFLVNSNP